MQHPPQPDLVHSISEFLANLSPTWAAFQQRAIAWSSPCPPLLFQTHWRVNECVVSIERHVDRDNGNGAPATTKDYFA